MKSICVGMGEIVLSDDANVELMCLGLGSCIAVCAYDAIRNYGALIHVVLPALSGTQSGPAAKYANTAIPLLVSELRKVGVRPSNVQIVLTGGAAIFAQMSGTLDIGQRNIVAVRAELQQVKLPIIREEVGGRDSRTVTLEVATGRVRLRTVRTGETVIANLGRAT